ncbi:MAG: TIR domain-containing protein, partial [Gammaproteobacteria bacterium]|nr:TIR domain-containing protein [Gammaproteobacteria bacterium]
MERPFHAYKGDGPYVFVSYSHKDVSAVHPELTWLRDCGFNVWYDEGIEAGAEWSEELASRIEAAKLFLYFVTPESAGSHNCRNEVNFALGNDIPTLAVHLRKTDLPGGLSLSLSAHQAILKHAIPDREYREKLQNRIAAYLEQNVVKAPTRVNRGALWSVVATVAVLGTGILLFGQYLRGGSVSEKEFAWPDAFSIVVFPFEQTTADQQIEAISRGLFDVVVQQLTQRRSCALPPVCQTLKVSRSDPSLGISEIAPERNVNYVLQGNIQRDGGVVQIRTQLLRTDNSSVWSKTYTRTLDDADVFTLQSEVANSVAELTAVWLGFDLLKLHASQHPALASAKPLARENFLKAREQALLANTGEGGDDRILLRTYLEKSIEADPEFALAYLHLAEAYTYRYGAMSLTEATTGALAYLEKAFELNPTDPQNLLLAGQVHLLMTLDYQKADALLRQGMEQYPDFGWFPAELAMIALREGRTPAALKLMATAEKIPFSSEQANFQYNYAWLLLLSGHYELSLSESALGL